MNIGRDEMIRENNNNPFNGREALLKKVLNHKNLCILCTS